MREFGRIASVIGRLAYATFVSVVVMMLLVIPAAVISGIDSSRGDDGFSWIAVTLNVIGGTACFLLPTWAVVGLIGRVSLATAARAFGFVFFGWYLSRDAVYYRALTIGTPGLFAAIMMMATGQESDEATVKLVTTVLGVLMLSVPLGVVAHACVVVYRESSQRLAAAAAEKVEQVHDVFRRTGVTEAAEEVLCQNCACLNVLDLSRSAKCEACRVMLHRAWKVSHG
ncbi:MAG: hypothetical protein QM621_01390 [Aeromicrobium sp.]|uniref:hypothetical protein n=1 Tax=Aeromicrobium sp. TaxID=1871063 RepID=UPI0039E70501